MGIRSKRGARTAYTPIPPRGSNPRQDSRPTRQQREDRRRVHALRRRERGFTLIELLIVVAVVAILAAIALPSYYQHVIRANRAQAKQFMQDVANRQEQYLLDQRSYTATIGSGGLGMTAPQETSGLYTFAAASGGNDCLGVALPTPGYAITATAVGGQAIDGNLCLDSINHKTPIDKWQR